MTASAVVQVHWWSVGIRELQNSPAGRAAPHPDHPCGCEYDDTPTACSICQRAAEPAGVQQRVDRLTISLQRAALFVVGPIGNRAPPAGTR
jgi:hypothetical protein